MSCTGYAHPEDADGTEGAWLDWRAVIAPRPGTKSNLTGLYRHKQEFVGHSIAEQCWEKRRKARSKHRAECEASGIEPAPHAPLTIYFPELFHGVCLDCPWVGAGWSSYGRAVNDSKGHQRTALDHGSER